MARAWWKGKRCRVCSKPVNSTPIFEENSDGYTDVFHKHPCYNMWQRDERLAQKASEINPLYGGRGIPSTYEYYCYKCGYSSKFKSKGEHILSDRYCPKCRRKGTLLISTASREKYWDSIASRYKF